MIVMINTVSFHNFKSQDCILSVSNPKSKHVAYVSVLSQILNCQGLGRKNKFEILKTDRSRRTSWQDASTNSNDSSAPCILSIRAVLILFEHM